MVRPAHAGRGGGRPRHRPELPARPDYDDLDGSPVVAHEFVCGSLTADPDLRKVHFPDLPLDRAEAILRSLEPVFLGINPHMDYIDIVSQGYGLVEMTPEATTVSFRVVDTYDPAARATTRAAWTIPVDSPRSAPDASGSLGPRPTPVRTI